LCVGGRLISIPRSLEFSDNEIVIQQLLSSVFVVGPSFRTLTFQSTRVSSTAVYAIYSNQHLRSLGYFDENLVRSQDLDLHSRARQANFLIKMCSEAVAVYQPPSSISTILSKSFKNGFYPACYGVIRFKQMIPCLAYFSTLVFVAFNVEYILFLLLLPLLYISSVIRLRIGFGVKVRFALCGVAYHVCHSMGVIYGFLSRLFNTYPIV
jgi:hypothetical protein